MSSNQIVKLSLDKRRKYKSARLADQQLDHSNFEYTKNLIKTKIAKNCILNHK